MLLTNLLNRQKTTNEMNYAKFMDGNYPIFSQFGDDIYASDVVQSCIDAIATECSKLQPKHIRISNNMQREATGSLNRLFKFAPNELMTTRDFLEKIIWQLYMNYNCFIYPQYENKMGPKGSTREYTGFYPLNPIQATFLQDSTKKLFVEFLFFNGDKYILPYSDVIHLRKKFSVNDIMGGGANGQPDNAAILKVLEINNTTLEGVAKAIKTSLAVRGIIKISTMLDEEGQKKEREKFERAIREGDTGILTMDLKGEYKDIKVDPKLIDKDTMQFVDDKILRYFGVSMPIINGDFTDEQYQAFYEKTLEPLIISLGQAFSKTIFTQRELDLGNEIVFYQKNMMYLSTKGKLELIKAAGEQGLLTDNQKLAVLGYPPIEGGDRITQSLNYIDKSLVNQYQIQKKNIKGGENID